MNTTEKNKLIAEFMGWKSTNILNEYYNDSEESWQKVGVLNINTFCYHSDWNWLMEVVEKIESLDIYYDKYIDHNSSMFTSGKIELSTKIEAVYNACVTFIEWYNEQPK